LIRGSWSEELLEGRVRQGIAGAWHYLAIGCVLFIWLSAILSALSGQESVLAAALGSLLLLVFLPLADAALYKIVEERAGVGPREAPAVTTEASAAVAGDDADEMAAAETASEPTTVIGLPSYALATIRILRILLTLVAALVLAGLWGVNILTLSAGGLGKQILGGVVQIGISVLIAYVAWEFIKRLIDRRIGTDVGPSGPGDEGGGTGASRIQTLLPLIRKFILVTLVVMTGMLVLSSMGINIGPLIAGAGMIGLAVGFGAQTLVRDVISGMFFLMDDAFRVGEYIDISSVKGTVERISVRSLQMRHHNGPVHTVPYGEIQYVTNYSRDWAIMKFELRIPFETDVDMVRRLIKKVGVAMMADEELGPLLLEPLKSQGVNRMDDSAFIVRCKFTSIPGQQFYLRREAYARIQVAFEAKGIKFAPKRVIVETASPGGATPAQAAAAAAATDQPGTGAPADDRG
jgi:small-conductance mechanosensitive channel